MTQSPQHELFHPPGVVILGGAHGALAAARSLGRQGVPVTLVSNDHPLPKFSRYIRKRMQWPGPDAPHALQFLLDLAIKEGLHDCLLIPAADADVRFVANHREPLEKSYSVISAPWSELENLCDKQLLAERAALLGIATPERYAIGSLAEAETATIRFPVVLKPATRESSNAFTQAKAWRADNHDQFVSLYREAASLVGEDAIVVQEFIPGGGEAQFSYAAAWRNGRPLAHLVARRTRQFPVEFSYTSTYVEIIARDEVREAAETLLSSVAFEGLVEIEFKFDPREGCYKVLDVNPRPWTWLALAEASGVNLPHLLLTGNESAAQPQPMAWIALTRDLLSAVALAASGKLPIGDYVRSFARPIVWASFAWDDPLPGLVELPILASRLIQRRLPALWRRKP